MEPCAWAAMALNGIIRGAGTRKVRIYDSFLDGRAGQSATTACMYFGIRSRSRPLSIFTPPNVCFGASGGTASQPGKGSWAPRCATAGRADVDMLTAASASGHGAFRSSGVELGVIWAGGVRGGVCPGGSARSGVGIDVGASRCNPMLTSIEGVLPSSQEAVTDGICPDMNWLLGSWSTRLGLLTQPPRPIYPQRPVSKTGPSQPSHSVKGRRLIEPRIGALASSSAPPHPRSRAE